MSKYILDDVVEEFFDKDSIEQDIHHHPISWGLALLCVLPPLMLVLLPDGDFSSLGPLEKIVVLAMETMLEFQFMIAPILCFALAYRRHVAPAVLVAMGSSAIIVGAGGSYINQLTLDYVWVGPLVAMVVIAPLVLVLRNKRKQLNPGRSRQVWATLMAVSILMFAAGTLVPAVSEAGAVNCTTMIDAGAAVLKVHDDECIAEWDAYGWASLGLVVFAIGWAWPRGRHIVEEIADDIVEAAT